MVSSNALTTNILVWEKMEKSKEAQVENVQNSSVLKGDDKTTFSMGRDRLFFNGRFWQPPAHGVSLLHGVRMIIDCNYKNIPHPATEMQRVNVV